MRKRFKITKGGIMRVQSINSNYQNQKPANFKGSAIFIARNLTGPSDKGFYSAVRWFSEHCKNKAINTEGITYTQYSPIGVLTMRCEEKDDAPFILMAKEFAQRQGWKVHTEEGFKYTPNDLWEQAKRLIGK